MPTELYRDYADLALYLLPLASAIALGLWAIMKRRDAKHQAELQAARDSRKAERDEMISQREAFYADIKSEVVRMRELYESELDRGISLRTALADAAHREMNLQETILDLTRKVETLQEEVAELRKELAARESWAS
ncbi:MAG: hypothetical protein V7704_22695 [Aurantimonas endophytica]|uniref:hypothetical protein n=1 Tax=Aurantimonas endophytica TaxID=1522175 RepID=UPI003001667E